MTEKRSLLFLQGETFRTGRQGNRNIGSLESMEDQKNACVSHLNFVKYICAEYNVKFDLIISTYKCDQSRYLDTWYGRDEGLFGSIIIKLHTHNASQCADHMSVLPTDTSHYLFTLHARPDIILKPPFNKLINPSFKQLMFLSICPSIRGWHVTSDGHPRVNDVIYFVPQKFHIYNRHKACHNSIDYLVSQGLKYPDDINVMVYEYYDSDSYKDKNPFYRISNRAENPNTISPFKHKITTEFKQFLIKEYTNAVYDNGLLQDHFINGHQDCFL